MESSDTELDVRGLKCPLPILRAKKILASMLPGQMLKVLATDPSTVKDFEAFTRQTGHLLINSTIGENNDFIFILRRK